MWKRLAVFSLIGLATAAPSHADDVSTATITRLIHAAEPGRKDANGWAVDLSVALQSNDLAVTRENACAAIAVIDQESSFVANPAVPGLGRLSEKALRDKLAGYPVIGAKVAEWLDTNPLPRPYFHGPHPRRKDGARSRSHLPRHGGGGERGERPRHPR
ncbi:DUF1615 family protein [Aestuariivirga sp.]|uniref:DUF1615 family protein n=1 Tax=Aestuariivirga sp. TaxID=2650926 RepID=UPI0039E5A72F